MNRTHRPHPPGVLTYQPQTCTACGGQKGHVETTYGQGGQQINTWRSCTECNGAGVR